MEGNFVAVLLLGAVAGVWFADASEDVAAAGPVAAGSSKNASYFVNPKQFLTYVGQIDKIKSLGEEVQCKLHGSCTDKRRKIPKKVTSATGSKKSMASRPRGSRMPDNHNNVLSPEAMMSPVAGGMLGGSDYTQQPEAIRSVRSAPTEVLKVNATTNANDNENTTAIATTTNSSSAAATPAAAPLVAAPSNKTASAVNASDGADTVAQNVTEAFPPTLSNSSATPPLVSLANATTTDTKNASLESSAPLNASSVGNDVAVANASTAKVADAANHTTASKPVDSKATKKSLASMPRISEDLPPIYLTVRNGEKVLVVHPTTEFLQSLPRINFTDPASEKPAARSSGHARAKGYTGIYAKRDELLLLRKKQREEIGERKTEVKEDADEEDGDEDNADDNNTDEDADEDADDSDNDEDDDDEGSSDASVDARSKITYASVPVYSPSAYGRSRTWLKTARSRISQRDLIRNMDSIRNNQLGNIYTTDEYLKGERKSATAELPVPRAIQNLYRKFHPEHSKANFNYIPSRDEVAEELQYAQQSASLNRAMQGNVEQSPETDLQASPEADYGSQDGDVGDGGTATMSNNEPSSWEQKYKNLDSDGRKRSENPMDYYEN